MFRTIGLLALAGVLLVGAMAPPATAQSPSPADTAFRVALQENGDASVSLSIVVDDATEADREALARMEANAPAMAADFQAGLSTVANRTAAETGRSMSVADPVASVRTEGDRGVVELSVTWRGLAAVDGQRLRLDAPFDDGFRPPGRFVVEAPDGYRFDEVTPEPTTTTASSVAWAPGTALDGLAATAAPAAEGDSMPTPGFGLPTAVVGVALVTGLALLTARRRR